MAPPNVALPTVPPARPRSADPRSRRRVHRAAGIVTALAAVLAGGCASPDPSDLAEEPAPAEQSAAAADTAAAGAAASDSDATGSGVTEGFPVRLENCGTTVTLDAPPQRILAIKSTSLELLLALGVGDRVIGSAFLDGPVPDRWADAAEQVPSVSDQVPGQEAVLELAPDLIVAGWESNLAADTAGTRQALADKGIASYVSPAACQGENQPPKLTYQMLFDSFTEMGRMLGVPDAAASLVAEQKQQLATVTELPAGTTALWWSSGSDTPYVGAGIGAPQMVMDAVGLQNVAGDIDQTWTSLGWEPIIEANPDVIVLVDASWNTAAHKIETLQDNPATARLDAVVHRRFVTVPFPAAEAGVRSVQAAVDITRQLNDLGMG